MPPRRVVCVAPFAAGSPLVVIVVVVLSTDRSHDRFCTCYYATRCDKFAVRGRPFVSVFVYYYYYYYTTKRKSTFPSSAYSSARPVNGFFFFQILEPCTAGIPVPRMHVVIKLERVHGRSGCCHLLFFLAQLKRVRFYDDDDDDEEFAMRRGFGRSRGRTPAVITRPQKGVGGRTPRGYVRRP